MTVFLKVKLKILHVDIGTWKGYLLTRFA